ncbi:hypothetical protein GCM10009115_00220 [Sphingopyxis soli]|uniref:Uncharacterized protein n=1 Tax=Sphingopyxis soli TaxID=592051 RepID=A0ABP3X4V7_9SPHN
MSDGGGIGAADEAEEDILQDVVEIGERHAAAEIFSEEREVRPEGLDEIVGRLARSRGGLDWRLPSGRRARFERLPGIVNRDVFSPVIGPIGAECHRESPYGDIL